MAQRFLIFLFIVVSMPMNAEAKVVLSEIAWMGTLENANAEWIELYNDGDSVDVSGWTLVATDGQPSIELSGSIPAHSYVLLERSSDETVSGKSAFSIYTGALGNTGEVLELRDANGSIVDSVHGADEWSIGGNNETKETLQRSGEPATGSWVTGVPSPLGGGVFSQQGEVDGTSQTRSVSASGGVLVGVKDVQEKEPRKEPALTLSIVHDATVVVGTKVVFEAVGFTENGRQIQVADVVWSFGDGSKGTGRKVSHTFMYEGEYVVTAHATRGGFLREITTTERSVVRVVTSPLSITHVDSACIEIKNADSEQINISGFVLVSGQGHFTIPEHTYILPGTSVRFSKKITGMSDITLVGLYYPDGTLVHEYGVTASPVQTVQVLHQAEAEPVTEGVLQKEVFFEERPFTLPEIVPVASAYGEMGDPRQEQTDDSLMWWVLGLCSVIGASVAAVHLMRKEQQEVIEGFIIESDE
jgi:Lamin Tail Domain/PKD domain